MRFLSSLAALLSWRVAGAIVIALQRVVLAGALGPRRLGAFGLATSTISILSRWLSFGAASSAQFYGSRGERPADTARTVLAVGVVIGLIALATAWLALPAIERLVFAQQPDGFVVFRRLLPWIPVVLLGIVASLLLLGQGRLKAYGVLQVVPDLAFLTALVLARFLNAGAAGAVAGQIIGWVTLAAGAVLFGYRHWSRGTVDARITRKLVGYGVRSWPLVMLQFGIARIAIIVGARYVAPEELGYYVLASGIADALSLVPGLAANLVFNAVSARRAGARELAFAVMRAASTGMWLVVVPAALVGRPLFDVLFGASFAPAWTLLVILFGTSLTRGIVPIHLAMLAGQGRPELANLVQLTEFGILLLVMPLAASRFGAVGMAVAAVTASASSYLVSLTIVRRFERARILDLVGIKRHDLLHIRQRLAGMIAARRIRTDGIG